MKYIRSVLVLIMLSSMLTGAFAVAGCTAENGSFSASGEENNSSNLHFSLYTVEDIKNLVTTDDMLVINYYDAYKWIVFLNKDNSVGRMIYIYEFESQDRAEEMVSVRASELRKNKTMSIISEKAIENYVVIELTDSSFSDISGDMLRSNFAQLIVTGD